MSESFHCKLCHKSIKIKSVKKHLNSQSRKSLSLRIISRYNVINPDILNIENILKNYILAYIKKFHH